MIYPQIEISLSKSTTQLINYVVFLPQGCILQSNTYTIVLCSSAV